MMDVSVIDTLRYASRLKAAGVESGQAEAMSRALNDEIGGGVATKGDLEHTADGLTVEIARVERELKSDISRVESELKGDISRVESELKGDISRVESELKSDISRVESELKSDISRVESGLARVEGELGRVESELKEDIGQLDGRLVRVEGELKRLDGRIDTLAAKFDTQGRYVFLVLALIAALGLYNVVFPPLATRSTQTADVQTVTSPAQTRTPGGKEQQPAAQR